MTIYGTAEGYHEYNQARHRAVEKTDDEITAALLVASEWLDATYRRLFKGYKVGARDVQVREWPRYAVHDHYGSAVSSASVPLEVEHATYEAAWRHLEDATALSRDYTPNKYKSVQIVGAVSVVYAGSSVASDVQQQFPIIDQILDPLLGGTGDVSSLSGSNTRV